tara:strand:+ start:1834 stop:2601 length:768 start_codon:yes stop_codon:yes gene_type:complete
MSAITNKSISEIFKDLFYIDNSNAGFTTTTKVIKDGGGGESSLNVSDRELTILPADDTTSTFRVKDKDGNAIFFCDTHNDVVKAGTNSQIVNTQYIEYFGKDLDLTGSKHVAIPRAINPNAQYEFGTGANPSIPSVITTTADDMISCVWFTDTAITIDNIIIWVAASGSGADTIRFHLISCDIDTSNSATGGDLSNIVINASGADITSAGYEQAYYQQITPSTSSIGANKAIFLTLKADSDNADYTVNAKIKYHL